MMRKAQASARGSVVEADIEAFARPMTPGDIFDETAGPGAHLAEGTRRMIQTACRRWLGFLKANYPEALLGTARRPHHAGARARLHRPPQSRDGRTTVAIVVDNLYYAARLIAPEQIGGG